MRPRDGVDLRRLSRSVGFGFARRLLGCATLLALLALAVQGLTGCSPKRKILFGNLPPETRVFLQGPIDTVSHRVHIYWFGSDVDGSVVAYRMRFVYRAPLPQDPPWDTVYCALPGRCTDSTFTVYTGDSTVVAPRFEIAAIDDDGAVDETPAVQTFVLTNLPPLVTITSPYGSADSTYASLTFSWAVDDPDGGGPGLRYRIWLDGNEARVDSTTGLTFTIPTSRFVQNGTLTSGPRTVYVQAVDDGGLTGPSTSMTWYVRAPAATLTADLRGEVLVVDEVPSGSPSNAVFDQFFTTALAAQLTPDRYSVLRAQFNPRMFRSARDFAQTLRQFKAVVWYRGLETSLYPWAPGQPSTPTWLRTYQDSLEAYLDSGGSLYLDGLYLVQGQLVDGALTEGFIQRHLLSTREIFSFSSSFADSTAGWSNTGNIRTGSLFRSSAYGDTIRSIVSAPTQQSQPGGIRGFVVTDTSAVALWAMAGQLVPANLGFEVPVGVTAPQVGGGQLVFLSMPLRMGAPVPAARLISRMLFGYNGVPGVIRPSTPLLGNR
jgi:hypothetical protein